MVDDLSHLLPSPGELQEMSAAGREQSLLRQFMTWLGVPAGRRPPAGQKMTVEWFHGEFPRFPFELSTDRVKAATVQDFFERPTKTAAYQTFCQAFGRRWATCPCALLFKCQGFTPLVLFSSPVLAADVRVALRFTVKDGPLFLSTMREFCDAYRERAGPLGS